MLTTTNKKKTFSDKVRHENVKYTCIGSENRGITAFTSILSANNCITTRYINKLAKRASAGTAKLKIHYAHRKRVRK